MKEMVRAVRPLLSLLLLLPLAACVMQVPEPSPSKEQKSLTETPAVNPEVAATHPVIEIEQMAKAKQAEESAKEIKAASAINKLCQAIGRKLGSVSIEDCVREQLIHSGYSTEGQSIAYREYLPVEGHQNLGKVLVLGGIHGDEFSSVSVVFKWLKILDRFHNGLFHWIIVPTVNPDGLLRSKSQRQNSNGIDLNRNFPTEDWSENAVAHWEQKTDRNPRKNPGNAPASEIETQWIVNQIDSFQPDVIISVHAPYQLVDYDGPPTAPESLGSLYLRKLGVYPGSLGNYVGIDRNKPLVTVELKFSGIMPGQAEIDTMWNDLVQWVRAQLQSDQTIVGRLFDED